MLDIKNIYNDLEGVVGSKYITDKDFMKAAYSRNVDPAFPDRWADIIIRPGSASEVSKIVQIANKYKIHMVPRGGGADLVGGASTEGGLLIDLTRMNNILEINEDNLYCRVECGVTWGALVSELYKRGLTTGVLGPGSGFSATICGGLSNSTAGFGSTKYGLVPDICLGVEVVLPNPRGDIIKTGASANRYAEPICRYGVAPDFTGLFMGDAGTLGIKTKAFLRIVPNSPYKIRKTYMLNSNDYDLLFRIMNKSQKTIREGLHDLYITPKFIVDLLKVFVKRSNKPKKRPRVRGPVLMFILEAFDERILDVYIEKLEEMMKDHARKFEWTEIDTSLEESKDWEMNLRFPYNYFNDFIAILPPKISCTTCHKVPIASMKEKIEISKQFDKDNQGNFPKGSASAFATSIHLLPNGHCVFAGGFNADNKKTDQREIAMDMWHKKVRSQVRYGGVHYWLGESISQSIVESGAYKKEFAQLFKDIKHTLDPNFLLSPNKFHMYSYSDNINKYIV
ncbi:MAG: FAD-binding oxidoreductase [Promethearchaeota archaeon]|nr:MAG: FAD-binding oxidoreductase [Candidatus Lokiarchaeota archaeon]